MACEALNWVLKRYIKEERPRGKPLQLHHMTRLLTPSRNAWKGIWHAFVPRPVCFLLLRHSDALPPLPARATPNRHPHALYIRRSATPFPGCHSLCRSCRCKPHISQLPHEQTSRCWYGSWRHLCICLVRLYNVSKKSRLDRLGTGDLDCKDASRARSRSSRGLGRFWMGKMGRAETKAKLSSPTRSGQEGQVSIYTVKLYHSTFYQCMRC